MVLESTMICVDNSDYMRNGDFIPTRLQAQQDAISLVCHSKARSNPENNVGLVVMSSVEVLATPTSEVGRILSKLHQVQPKGNIRFITAVRVAHLALKHRQGRNHKMRIVVFVGSPVEDDEKELVKLAKKLKKEKVNVDVVNFGEEEVNTDKLTTFINTVNGKDGTSCHLVTVSPGPMLSDALLSSPVVMGEDGTGVVPGMGGSFEFGVDPNEDPELALALRVSMEEQRARQEDEARKVASSTAESVPASAEPTVEEALLEQAMSTSLSMPVQETQSDFSTMTEDEQIAYALQMSMQNTGAVAEDSAMEVDDGGQKKGTQAEKKSEDEDYSDVLNDPAFLQNVLENLPGVDPHSEAIRSVIGPLTERTTAKKDDSKKDDKSKDNK